MVPSDPMNENAVKVRMDDALKGRLDRARVGLPRERAIREAITLWCAVQEGSQRVVDSSGPASELFVREGSVEGVLAGTTVPHWRGCSEHPTAGATESRGQMWCAEPGCTRAGVLR